MRRAYESGVFNNLLCQDGVLFDQFGKIVQAAGEAEDDKEEGENCTCVRDDVEERHWVRSSKWIVWWNRWGQRDREYSRTVSMVTQFRPRGANDVTHIAQPASSATRAPHIWSHFIDVFTLMPLIST